MSWISNNWHILLGVAASVGGLPILLGIWRRYTISGNVMTVMYWGERDQERAKKRLIRMGEKALPSIRKQQAWITKRYHQARKEQGRPIGGTIIRDVSDIPPENMLLMRQSVLLGEIEDVIERQEGLLVKSIEKSVEPDVGEPHRGHWRLALPPGWRPSTSDRSRTGHMEFFGPDGNSIRFAIGPISPEPTVEEQKRNLAKIAEKHGHTPLATGEIQVQGKVHATMTCEIPGVGRIRNYSIILGGVEYLATAKGDLAVCDSLVKTFKTA